MNEQVAVLKKFITDLYGTMQQGKAFLSKKVSDPQISALQNQVAGKVINTFLPKLAALKPILDVNWKKETITPEERNVISNMAMLVTIMQRAVPPAQKTEAELAAEGGKQSQTATVTSTPWEIFASLELQLNKYIHKDGLLKKTAKLAEEKGINPPTIQGVPYNLLALVKYEEAGYSVALFEAPNKHMTLLDVGTQVTYFMNDITGAVTISANPFTTGTIKIQGQTVDLFENADDITISGTGPVASASVVAATHEGKRTREARSKLASDKQVPFEDLVSPAQVPLDKVLEIRKLHSEQIPSLSAA